MMDRYNQLSRDLEKLNIAYLLDEAMKDHTSFRIGGPAKLYVTPNDTKELAEAYAASMNLGVRTYILGKGTNVLFDDRGYDGAVISTLSLDRIEMRDGVITSGAGHSLTSLARFALEQSVAPFSFAYGIPGSVGGGVYMNAGAYNGEISNVLTGSTYLDTRDGSINTLSAEEHDFAYRFSSYKKHPERIILEASFKTAPADRAEIKAEMDDFMNRRRTKQPLEWPSAGSVFKRYPGRYTTQMIDEAGLKGACVGGAKVSEKHAGFIINTGDAKSGDVLSLISLIKSRIKEKFSIDIETEIIYVEG